MEDGKKVIGTGLELDFKAEPFGQMPQLLCLATTVDKLHAVCMKCGCEHATRTQRLIDGKPADKSSPLIMIGGNIGFTAGTLLLVAGLVLIIVSSLRPAGIQVSSDSLVITGSYKYSVELGEIRSVERLDSLPKIKIRINGIGWPNIKIGHFLVEGIGKLTIAD